MSNVNVTENAAAQEEVDFDDMEFVYNEEASEADVKKIEEDAKKAAEEKVELERRFAELEERTKGENREYEMSEIGKSQIEQNKLLREFLEKQNKPAAQSGYKPLSAEEKKALIDKIAMGDADAYDQLQKNFEAETLAKLGPVLVKLNEDATKVRHAQAKNDLLSNETNRLVYTKYTDEVERETKAQMEKGVDNPAEEALQRVAFRHLAEVSEELARVGAEKRKKDEEDKKRIVPSGSNPVGGRPTEGERPKTNLPKPTAVDIDTANRRGLDLNRFMYMKYVERSI